MAIEEEGEVECGFGAKDSPSVLLRWIRQTDPPFQAAG